MHFVTYCSRRTGGHQDGFQHVNNAHYIRWCEAGRIHWIMQLAHTAQTDKAFTEAAATAAADAAAAAAAGGAAQKLDMFAIVQQFMSGVETGPILKSIYYNFQSAVTYPDCVVVGSRIQALGRDRFSLTHRLVSIKQEKVVGEAEVSCSCCCVGREGGAASNGGRGGASRGDKAQLWSHFGRCCCFRIILCNCCLSLSLYIVCL
jgi:acyl-CoA thioesterase FadM